MSDTSTAAAAAGDPPNDGGDIETRARRMGWRPKDEFRGPSEKWVPADEFVARGENELPVLRERFRALNDNMGRLERTTATEIGGLKQQLKETTDVLGEFRDFSRKAAETAYERARREIRAEMEEAVRSADPSAFKTAQTRLDELEAEKPAAAPKPAAKEPAAAAEPAKQQVPQAVTDWAARNPWFTRDITLNAYATTFYGDLKSKNPSWSEEDLLADVEEEVKSRFPEKFENPRRKEPSTVGSPREPGGSKKKGKSYDDLPTEAKAACDKFMRQIPGYKVEDYLRDYDWRD